MIFSAHPSSPVVVARSFPPTSPIILPSPNPVLNNPNAFSPPKIIEVSSGDEYLFAFFEGRGGEHAACVWQRDGTLDSWKVCIFWPVRPGQAIVLAKWLGDDRTVRCTSICATHRIYVHVPASGYILPPRGGHHLWVP